MNGLEYKVHFRRSPLAQQFDRLFRAEVGLYRYDFCIWSVTMEHENLRLLYKAAHRAIRLFKRTGQPF